VRVRRHDSPLGRWEMVHAAPHPALRGAVLRYCGYGEDMRAPLRRREVATPAVTVIFSFGPSIRVRSGRFSSFAAGVDESYDDTEHDGHQRGLEVKLSPLAVRRLLGVPAPELAGQVVELDALLGRTAGELTERMALAPGWPERFTLLDAAFGERLARTPRTAPDVVHAWRRLVASHGGVSIAGLAGELGWSRRHFGARFREHVGLAPKPAARVLRFRRAVELLERDDGTRLAEIAQACGYYDQAHLNRDFRAFAGASPGDHLGRRLPDGGGVAAAQATTCSPPGRTLKTASSCSPT
jgi:AraC-like DNA-binding protein